jgi:hypothetical protein
MKNSLSDIYEQVLLSEAEKHNLQNPSADEVGKLPKENIFDSKPKPVEGAEKAKLQKGPQYQQTTGTSSAPKASGSSSGPKGAPAKSTEGPKGKEMKDTDVDPTEDEDGEDTEPKAKKKDPTHKESFTMSAFETLFKKTLMNEEVEEEMAPVADGDGELSPDTDIDIDAESDEEDREEEIEEEEGDLISDLRELQDKLASILDKLEDLESEEEEMEGQEYTENEFDTEFEDQAEGEEAPMGESLKALSPSKGKSLQSKNNKVKGTLSSAKKGKAKPGTLKEQPKPTALGDKKKVLQNKSNKVKSNITKGEFFK